MFFAGAIMILMLSGYLINMVVLKIARPREKHFFLIHSSRESDLFDTAYSFQIRLDAKHMGLVVFLLANIFTGFINIYFEEIKFTDDESQCLFNLIICFSTCLAICLPTALRHYYLAGKKKKRTTNYVFEQTHYC